MPLIAAGCGHGRCERVDEWDAVVVAVHELAVAVSGVAVGGGRCSCQVSDDFGCHHLEW